MSQEKTHDLHDFMRQLQDKMTANYKQIQKRASEDPGTAGDQGIARAHCLWIVGTFKS